ncbi:hypothetical protein AXZ95_1561 [Leifsonia sp. 115AMFTsu3.1]|nr:hypothetical protein AXZ95_1561 [Leifsonia sp. 115AMFTsu3.1]
MKTPTRILLRRSLFLLFAAVSVSLAAVAVARVFAEGVFNHDALVLLMFAAIAAVLAWASGQILAAPEGGHDETRPPSNR